MSDKIEVRYSCRACGLLDIAVDAPIRTTEDVSAWMEMVGHVLSGDHHRRSPKCRPETLTDVKIPYTGRSKIGGPVEQ